MVFMACLLDKGWMECRGNFFPHSGTKSGTLVMQGQCSPPLMPTITIAFRSVDPTFKLFCFACTRWPCRAFARLSKELPS